MGVRKFVGRNGREKIGEKIMVGYKRSLVWHLIKIQYIENKIHMYTTTEILQLK
jgi:hypothetical protein